MIFGSFECTVYIVIKPSEETLKQGRNASRYTYLTHSLIRVSILFPRNLYRLYYIYTCTIYDLWIIRMYCVYCDSNRLKRPLSKVETRHGILITHLL